MHTLISHKQCKLKTSETTKGEAAKEEEEETEERAQDVTAPIFAEKDMGDLKLQTDRIKMVPPVACAPSCLLLLLPAAMAVPCCC